MPSTSRTQHVSRRRRRSISDIQGAAICRYQRQNPNVNSASVIAWARDELNATVSSDTISRLLKKFAHGSRATFEKIIQNILEEYTQALLSPTGNHHHEDDQIQMSKPFLTVTTGGILGNGDTLAEDVQEQLQAWIFYLQAAESPDSKQLVTIAQMHLQNLDNRVINKTDINANIL